MQVLVEILGNDKLSKELDKGTRASKAMSKGVQNAMTQVNNRMAKAATFAKNFNTEVRNINGTSIKTTRSINSLNNQLDKIRQRRNGAVTVKGIKQANREISQLERRINKLQNSGSGGGLLGKLKGGLGAALPFAGGFAAFQAFDKVKDLGFQREKDTVAFESMLGGLEKANSMMAKLNNLANSTPLINSDLFAGAKTLLAFGGDANKVPTILQKIGDVALGDRDRIKSLTLAYAQMSSAGKLMGQDLLQMVNAGFNPLQMISEATGKSMGTLRKKMEQGAISSKMVETAFSLATSKGGRFFQAMKKQSETGFGKMSTFIGKASDKLAIFSAAYLAPTIGLLAEMGSYVLDNAELFGGLALAVGSFFAVQKIGALFAFIKGLNVLKVLTGTMTVKQWLLNSAMWANPVGIVTAAIIGLGATFVWAWNKFDGFRGAIMGGWEVMKRFGSIIKDVVVRNIQSLMSGLSGIAEAFKLLFDGKFSKAYEVGKKAAVDLGKGLSTFNPISLGAQVFNEAKDRKLELRHAFIMGDQRGRHSSNKIKLPSLGGAGSSLTNALGVGGNGKVDTSIFNSLKGGGIGANMSDGRSGGSGSASTQGNRAISFSIKIDKFFDNMTIVNNNADETAESIADKALERLLSVFNELGLQAKVSLQRV